MNRVQKRWLWGGGAALVAFAVGGPALAMVAWKGVGFAVTGNPLHLIPGGGFLGDGADAIGVFADASGTVADTGAALSDAADVHGAATEALSTNGGSVFTSSDSASLADGAPNIQGNPGNWDIHQNPTSDVQGNELGRLGTGGYPSDILGNRT